MKAMNIYKAAASLLLFGASLQAQAGPVTWYLDNVTFADGATATGSFTADLQNKTWWDFDITTTDGAISGFHYTPDNTYFGFPLDGHDFLLIKQDMSRYLGFEFVGPLTDAGGTVAINASLSWECNNCSPWRSMSGSVTTLRADVPEPAGAALLLPALGMLGWMTRRRSIAATPARAAGRAASQVAS